MDSNILNRLEFWEDSKKVPFWNMTKALDLAQLRPRGPKKDPSGPRILSSPQHRCFKLERKCWILVARLACRFSARVHGSVILINLADALQASHALSSLSFTRLQSYGAQQLSTDGRRSAAVAALGILSFSVKCDQERSSRTLEC